MSSQNQGPGGTDAGAASPQEPGTNAQIEASTGASPHDRSGSGRPDHHLELADRFPDPGLPRHVHRVTDTDPKAARRAERQVTGLFLLSLAGTILFVAAYVALPLGDDDLSKVATSNLLLGLGLGIALFCIGAGAVHWAKKLMPDDEVVEERHPIASTPQEREEAAAILATGGEAAGFGRRKMIWGSLVASVGALGLPAILPLRDLWVRGAGEDPPYEQIARTYWREGLRLVTDGTGHPIRPEEIPIGGVVHVLPEGIAGRHGGAHEDTAVVDEGEEESAEELTHQDLLRERAKASTLLIRLEPEDLDEEEGRADWSYNGIVAYSKICTHMGCPVALYEQQTHLLLCPCHQSTFDVERHCAVIFGPAARPLPQLPIGVDEEGYLVARSDFLEPVGPSYWERG